MCTFARQKLPSRKRHIRKSKNHICELSIWFAVISCSFHVHHFIGLFLCFARCCFCYSLLLSFSILWSIKITFFYGIHPLYLSPEIPWLCFFCTHIHPHTLILNRMHTTTWTVSKWIHDIDWQLLLWIYILMVF